MNRLHRRLIVLLTAIIFAFGAAVPACGAGAAAETLKLGDKGRAVKEIKLRLYELGYFRTDNLSQEFSEATVEALQAFQRQNGLEPTGVLTPEVRDALYGANAQPYVSPTPTPAPTPRPTPVVAYPERDAEGYLAGEGEFVYENDEEGMWVYLTQNLQISIVRKTDSEIPLEWFETDIRLRGGERLMTVENNPERPGTRFKHPHVIAADNRFVLGFTDDFYGHRINRGEKVGIVIRDGSIISDKTYRKQLHNLPNLDMLAQFEDGSLKAYGCAEITAEELLNLGAVNVFCFGPVLIKDGEINPLVLEKWYETKSPRQALGMIEPGHYLLLSVQGRMKSSEGTGLIRMAQMMKERGVEEALNLDGGNTMALVFRGRMINKLATWQNKKFVRTVSSLIGVGLGDYERPQ